MSWTSKKENLRSTLFSSWGLIFCISRYKDKDIKIYFNSGFTGFDKVDYGWDEINLNWINDKVWERDFIDSDSTRIRFNFNSYNLGDWIDDNFDNDDFSIKTTN
jgi:hypothetical protein